MVTSSRPSEYSSRSERYAKRTDEEEENPIFGYNEFAEGIVQVIKGSVPDFSIGIYGDWGTGKSTLMKLIESKINNETEPVKIAWDDLDKLKGFLSNYYDIDWIKDLDLKIDNDRSITGSDNRTSAIKHQQSKINKSQSFFSLFRRESAVTTDETVKNYDAQNIMAHLLSIGHEKGRSKATFRINDEKKDEFDIERGEDGKPAYLKG